MKPGYFCHFFGLFVGKKGFPQITLHWAPDDLPRNTFQRHGGFVRARRKRASRGRPASRNHPDATAWQKKAPVQLGWGTSAKALTQPPNNPAFSRIFVASATVQVACSPRRGIGALLTTPAPHTQRLCPPAGGGGGRVGRWTLGSDQKGVLQLGVHSLGFFRSKKKVCGLAKPPKKVFMATFKSW